jgi:hypothetical protein
MAGFRHTAMESESPFDIRAFPDLHSWCFEHPEVSYHLKFRLVPRNGVHRRENSLTIAGRFIPNS